MEEVAGFSPPSLRCVDFFAGIGGFGLGFRRAGFQVVYANEWNTSAAQTYMANHPIPVDTRGIHDIPCADIPSHDVFLAGFPCQPFSQVGRARRRKNRISMGFDDARQGTAFFEIVRILKAHRPKCVLLENVPAIRTIDGGRVLKTIHRSLGDLGYASHEYLIDARHWLPQQRRRFFMLAVHSGGLLMPEPVLPSSSPRLKDALHHEREPVEAPYTECAPDGRTRVASRYTITEYFWRSIQNSNHRKGLGFKIEPFTEDDQCGTLTTKDYMPLIRQAGSPPRKLTPRERARVMGFDRAGESPFVIPVSDTAAARQFGNAVCPPVVEVLARIVRSI